LTTAVRFRCIFFDAGGTLISSSPPIESVISNVLAGRGASLPPSEVIEAFLEAELERWRSRADFESLLSKGLHRRAKVSMDLAEFSVWLAAEVKKRAPHRNLMAYPDAVLTLAELKRLGLVRGVISNWDGTAEAVLKRLGLAAYLDVVIDSGVVGVSKPDPGIFQIALGKVMATPESSLFVGDALTDIRGGQGAGLRVAWLNRTGASLPSGAPQPDYTIGSLSQVLDLIGQ